MIAVKQRGLEIMYRELNKQLVDAIQEGQLDLFIQQLNQSLRINPSHYMYWLFVARAYEAKGDIENASNSYIHLIRLSSLDHPNTPRLLDEIRSFVYRHRRNELIEIAEGRFGAGCLSD